MLERVLRQWPSTKGLQLHLLVTLAATLSFVPVFLPLEQRMQRAGRHGIVELELAPDPDQVNRIMTDWVAGGTRDEAILSLQVDFAFLVAYSLLLAGLVLWAARGDEGAWQARGFALVPWCLAAGLFDAVENCLALVTLHMNDADPVRSGLGATAALAKFTIVAAALAYAGRGGVRRLRGRRAA